MPRRAPSAATRSLRFLPGGGGSLWGMKSEASFVRTLLDALSRLLGTGPAQGAGTTPGRATTPAAGSRPAPKSPSKNPAKSSSKAPAKGRGTPAATGSGTSRPATSPAASATPARSNRAAGAKPAPGPKPAPAGAHGTASWEEGGYPGDFTGSVRARYAPSPDGRPDPGEIVWAWVPYEEDHTQGKDRPVLLVGHDGDYLLALMLTSKDRNNGIRRDEDYLDVGTGPWDRQGRPSEVKLDRVVRLLPGAVRREGAVLDRARFEEVAKRL